MPQSIEAAIWSRPTIASARWRSSLALLIARCRNFKRLLSFYFTRHRQFGFLNLDFQCGVFDTSVWKIRSFAFAVLRSFFLRSTPLKYLQTLRNAEDHSVVSRLLNGMWEFSLLRNQTNFQFIVVFTCPMLNVFMLSEALWITYKETWENNFPPK
jgi:hypothetical protein